MIKCTSISLECMQTREHTDSYSGTESEPILVDRIFTDPL